jgi:hypothetical protein
MHQSHPYQLRQSVLTLQIKINIRSRILWGVMLCSLVLVLMYCLHIQDQKKTNKHSDYLLLACYLFSLLFDMKMEAVHTSEMPVNLYQTV